MQQTIKNILLESAEVKKQVAQNLSGDIERFAQIVINAFKHKRKVVFCGNGGSAADAQHLATEFVHQFEKKRIALPAIALTTDTSMLTAIGNDWGFDQIFSRQVEGLVQEGDVFVGLTTSGNSANVLRALDEAKKKKAHTIILSGRDGGKSKDLADLNIIIPSQNTARIQESHLCIGHIVCKLVDDAF